MAQLCFIENNFNIKVSNFINYFLSLPDEYISIFNLFDNYVIVLFTKENIFFISYQKLIYDKLPIEDDMIYLREFCIKFDKFIKTNNINIKYIPNLIILTDIKEEEIYSSNISIVYLEKIKIFIQSSVKNESFSENDFNNILNSLKIKINKKIGKYQIITKLNFSEYTNTYIGFNLSKEKLFILKEINIKEDNSLKEKLIREAKLTTNLNSDNTLKIEEIIENTNSIFIVTEYLPEYISLRKFIIKESLKQYEIVNIIKQICSSLEEAHNIGIIHRNIRPENILINKDLKIKVFNFELAKKYDVSTRKTFDIKKILKNNPYTAPEFEIGIKGHHDLDQRADIYSVGIVFYELLVGKVPEYIDEEKLLLPSNFNKEINTEIDRIIEKTIKIDIEQRYSTINALKVALSNYSTINKNTSKIRYTDRKIYKKTKNSIIYQAYDNQLNKKIALKKVSVNGSLVGIDRLHKLEKINAETNILKRLINPNIISIYDFFIEDDNPYIVMEFIEGNTLRELQNKNINLSINEIINIIYQVCSAINYAHYQNIIHKDIKPENIIYNNGRITIIDFGLSNLFENSNYGTPLYMSPEQINSNGIIDQKVDIFAIGILFYELVTDSLPFDADTIINKYSSKKINIISPSERNPLINKRLSNCILKAIKINPEERYSSIKEFVQEIEFSQLNRKENNYLKYISIFMILLSFIYPIKFILTKKNNNTNLNIDNKSYILMPALKDIFEGKIDKYIPYSNWEASSILLDNINIQSNIIENKENTDLYLVINNYTDDNLLIIKDNNIRIIDDKGNNYSNKLDIKIPEQLIYIEANSFAKGYISLKDILNKDTKKLFISIMEISGKNRKFSFTLNKKIL